MDSNTDFDADTTNAHASRHRALRVFLIVIATIETVGSLSNLPGLFGGLSAISSGAAQWIINVGLAVLPVPALAALVFAWKGQLDHAIMAIAAIVLVIWITYLPPV